MDQKVESDYLYFDPKGNAQTKRRTQPYREGIVFVVGGGNYLEYHNLQDYANSSGKRIIYGCSDLLSPTNFLSQLEKIA